MKKLILILSLLAASLFVIPIANKVSPVPLTPATDAGTQSSCSNPGTSGFSIKLWENPINDFSDDNDNIWAYCNTPAPNGWCCLQNHAHTLPGGCHSIHPFHGANWNDCVDSVTLWGLSSSLWHICFYYDQNFVNGMFRLDGPITNGSRYDLNVPDELTSFWVVNDGSFTCDK